MNLGHVIITGPTGVVGRNLIDALLERGVHVTAVCRPDSPRLHTLPQHPLLRTVECEISKLPRLAPILPPQDAFFHFAWGGTAGAARNDMTLQMANVQAALDAVEAARALGCAVFLGAGSQAEYGRVEGTLRPDTPCFPETGYGAAKLSAGAMTRVLCNTYGIRHNWCRILSIFGAYDGAHTMVMSVANQLLDGRAPDCTKGEQLWDYLYAKDLARALIAIAQNGKENAVYCPGSGAPRQLRDYILAIRDAVNPQIEPNFGAVDYYPNQVMHLEADNTALTADTGFVPQYTFEEGIQETIQWMREQRNG